MSKPTLKEEIDLPLQEKTVFATYRGLKYLGQTDGWDEHVHNDNLVLVLYSAPKQIADEISERIKFIKDIINT